MADGARFSVFEKNQIVRLRIVHGFLDQSHDCAKTCDRVAPVTLRLVLVRPKVEYDSLPRGTFELALDVPLGFSGDGR